MADVIEHELSKNVKIFAYEERDDGRLVNGRWHTVPREDPRVHGHVVLPKGYSRAKLWKRDETGDIVEFVPGVSEATAAEIRVRRSAHVVAMISAEMTANVSTADQLALEDFTVRVGSLIQLGSFVLAKAKIDAALTDPTTPEGAVGSLQFASDLLEAEIGAYYG